MIAVCAFWIVNILGAFLLHYMDRDKIFKKIFELA